MEEIVKIQNLIYEIRGNKVMLDSDLAQLYGVETFNLNKAVKRNLSRFPRYFMFQLTKDEYESLIFQIGISKPKRGGLRFMPYVFTEQGVAMLIEHCKDYKEDMRDIHQAIDFLWIGQNLQGLVS